MAHSSNDKTIADRLRNLLKNPVQRLLALCGYHASRGRRYGLRGDREERMAARFLRQNGYRILERNFHCTGGELDIVAFRDGIVAFIEVRARGIRATVDPLETVTREKQKRVLRAAQQYASLRQLHREDVVLRLDLVAVHKQKGLTPPRIEHIKDAFQLNSPT